MPYNSSYHTIILFVSHILGHICPTLGHICPILGGTYLPYLETYLPYLGWDIFALPWDMMAVSDRCGGGLGLCGVSKPVSLSKPDSWADLRPCCSIVPPWTRNRNSCIFLYHITFSLTPCCKDLKRNEQKKV